MKVDVLFWRTCSLCGKLKQTKDLIAGLCRDCYKGRKRDENQA